MSLLRLCRVQPKVSEGEIAFTAEASKVVEDRCTSSAARGQVAVDVCKVLGYKNVTDILKKHVDEADLSKREARSGGQIRKVNFVNESGL